MTLIWNIDEKNKCYVFVSKGTHVMYSNPNLREHEGVEPIWKVCWKIELFLDKTTF